MWVNGYAGDLTDLRRELLKRGYVLKIVPRNPYGPKTRLRRWVKGTVAVSLLEQKLDWGYWGVHTTDKNPVQLTPPPQHDTAAALDAAIRPTGGDPSSIHPPADIINKACLHAKELRAVSQMYCGLSSCISTSDALAQMFRYFDVSSIPMVARAVIVPGRVARYLRDKGRPYSALSPAEVDEITHLNERVVYLGWGGGTQELGSSDVARNLWFGHLGTVAFAGDSITFFDLTIDQANRPQHGIELSPIACRITPQDIEEGIELSQEQTGLTLIYTFFPAEASYVDTGDAMSRTEVALVAGQMSAFLEGVLAGVDRDAMMRVATEISPGRARGLAGV